jgi:two-component system, OmpR family, alkaline phosphatase synthesis response regulator PhoP
VSSTILVIEDDRQIRSVIEAYLKQAGYTVQTASDGATGLALAQQEKPRLIVLDLMLPAVDGMEIARRLRASSDPAIANVYIIMLTARVEESDRVVGLELGADDYVTKPFSPRELTARIRSALRRLEGQTSGSGVGVLQSGPLRLDSTYRSATLAGQAVDLTSTEWDLLHHFMRHPGRPFSRDELLTVTQGGDTDDLADERVAYERTIDVHIKNIRQKLGDSGRHSRFIETVHGVGYRFLPHVERG